MAYIYKYTFFLGATSNNWGENAQKLTGYLEAYANEGWELEDGPRLLTGLKSPTTDFIWEATFRKSA